MAEQTARARLEAWLVALLNSDAQELEHHAGYPVKRIRKVPREFSALLTDVIVTEHRRHTKRSAK